MIDLIPLMAVWTHSPPNCLLVGVCWAWGTAEDTASTYIVSSRDLHQDHRC